MTTPVLKVRITNADYSLQPRGSLDHTSLAKVPVLRVYGLSSTGYKTCVHIHDVYPYFYVDYKGPMNPDAVSKYVSMLQRSLNHAVALSLRREIKVNDSRFRYVRMVQIVKGVHFYGFHCSYSPFLKIHVVDPQHVARIATILRSGGVMQRRFQVFESHLSYLLQFMCDYGLYGCGELEIAEALVRERTALEVSQEEDDLDTSMFDPSPYPRQSRLPLELDVAAYHILNPRLLVPRNIHNVLTIPALPPPSDPLVLSVRELWEDERKRRIAKNLPPTPVMPSDGAANRGTGPGWRAEPRLRTELQERIETDRESKPEYVAPTQSWERFVMTAFESREALWPPEFRTWKPDAGSGESPFSTPDEEYAGQTPKKATAADDVLDVDEAFLKSQRMVDLVRGADKEPDYNDFGGDEDRLVDRSNQPDVSPTKGTHRAGAHDESPSRPATPGAHPSVTKTPSKASAYGAFTPLRRSTSSSYSVEPEDAVPSSRKRRNPFNVQSWADVESGTADQDSPTKNIHGRSGSFARQTSLALSIPGIRSAANTPLKSTSSYSAGFKSFGSSRDIDPMWAPTIPATEPSDPDSGGSFPATIPETQVELKEKLGLERFQAPKVAVADVFSSSPVKTSPTKPPTPETRNDSQTSEESERLFKRRRLHGLAIRWQPSLDSARTSEGSADTAKPLENDTRPRSSTAYVYPLRPPSSEMLLADLGDTGQPEMVYRDPYYSNVKDIPRRPREYAGILFKLKGGTGVGSLEEWKTTVDGDESRSPSKRAKPNEQRKRLASSGVISWEYAGGVRPGPPSRAEVLKWLEDTDGSVDQKQNKKPSLQSQILGPTQKNRYGFKVTQNKATDSSAREQQNMSVLSIEVFATSRGSLLPNPEFDRVECIFYAFQEQDVVITNPVERRASYLCGCIAIESAHLDPRRIRDMSIEVVDSELDLINTFVDRVREWDPDIVTGWEVQNASWGYLAQRAWNTYDLSISELVSRIISTTSKAGNVLYDSQNTSTFHVAGRHVLNTWRIMRVEQTLSNYTPENVAFHVLHRRIPHYSAETLTKWFASDVPEHTARTLKYLTDRTAMNLEILDETQVVTKNAEFARVFGVEFFSVLSRGSQFKVESFMFRIAKPESLMLLSPSREDVGKQNAAECIPLIMEPKSAYYKSPLVVLDFQSLYPSIMIAYNYCYSTCLGRVGTYRGKNKFGVLEDLKLPDGLLGKVEDHITFAPNGMIYVKPSVRQSLLAKMLTELLETRVMVKQAMKTSKDDKALMRVLDARQLSLKFICNVTYGYTSASFSGRMPAVEVADSIVQSGRETLENAITTINTTSKWGAKVVYGDTDSLFISLEGKTKEQAFRIGHEMADAITAMNPRPVKLKFEKVYFPCVLMAKKRYVGFKYENPDDTEPVFDAKGIETVRRDGIPAGQKMLEKCIKILFRRQDLSEVKSYCQSSWTKLMDGRVSLQDFIFAKEVRMGGYSDKGPPPPGVVVAARRVTRDPRAEAQYGDRIQYVITRGEPKSRLVDRAFEPLDVLKDPHQYHLDAAYYIEHQLIPPLERVFNLVGANVASWYAEMPKVARPTMPDLLVPAAVDAGPSKSTKFTIDEHFKSKACIVCGKNASQLICGLCRESPQETAAALQWMRRGVEKRVRAVQEVCASCSSVGVAEDIECDSLDCGWMFERQKAFREQKALCGLSDVVDGLG